MQSDSVISFGQAPFSRAHKKVAAGTFMGMVSDGYVVGIIGITLSYAQPYLHLSSAWLGFIGAGSILGAVLGSFLTGTLSDRIGRKPLYALLMALGVIFSLWQYWLSNPFWLAAARIALGFVNGSDYAVSITLLSEWAPERQREKLTAMLIVFWTIGYSLSYLTGFFMDGIVAAFGDNGWRFVLCTSAIPALIAFCIRVGSPESPVWLVAKKKYDQARAVIQANLGSYSLPKDAGQKREAASWFALFGPEQWRYTVVSCVFFFAQFLPFFAISIFLPLVFTQMGMANPRAAGALYNAFTLLGVFVGSWAYIVMSRRAFLLSTFYLAAAILACPLIWLSMPSYLALAMMSAFALILAASLVPEFTYPAELFPTALRGSGVGLTIAVSDLGAWAGAFLLPVLSENYGIHVVLWGCVGSLLLGGAVCQLWAPETSGRGRHKIDKVQT